MILPWEQPEQNDVPKIEPNLQQQFDTTPREEQKVYYVDAEMQEPGLEGQFYLTQSLIKKIVNQHMFEVPHCPRNIYHLYIKKDYKSIVTDAQFAGLYGETLILGHSAKGNEFNDAPLNKSGGKYIAFQRIEMQAERFKVLSAAMQINIIPKINTQVPIFKRYKNSNVILRGELDIFPTTFMYNGELRLAMIDVKFTADVNSTFGQFCWGDPHNMDHLQADMYQYLVRDFDYDLNSLHGAEFNRRVGYSNIITESVHKIIKNNELLFFYIVFGYKNKDMNNQIKVVERLYEESAGGNLRQREVEQRINMTTAILTQNHLNEWQPNPIPAICKDCPLSSLKENGFCKEHLRLLKV